MKDGPRYRVEFVAAARRELQALRDTEREAVRQAVRELADDPTPPDSREMVGKAEGLHRLRVGMYRVVYRIQNERLVVLVIRVGHRSEVYRGFERP